MNRFASPLILAFLLSAVGCTAQIDGADPVPPVVAVDAAPPIVPAVDSAPTPVTPGADAGQLGKDAAPEAAPPPGSDAAPSGPDAQPPGIDATPDAGQPEASLEAASPEAAGPDATGPDSAPPSTADAGSDGGDGGLQCASTAAGCASANRAADAIRTTFAARTCTDPTVHKCGGVIQSNVTVTYPMDCVDGRWVYAWCLRVECYSCSNGCVAGQLCNP